jgi:pSer/pThr/pTyr-binding forkhead associated (FHA) protein
MPRLFVLSGDDLGRAYDFDHAVVLGRGETADLRLRSVSVSRHHARVEPDPATGGWRVVDLDSRNGVAVDGRKVPTAPLTDGGVFVLGDIEVRFRAEGAPAPGAPIVVVPGSGAPLAEPASAPEPIVITPRRAPAPPPPPPTIGLADDSSDELELEGDWTAPLVPPPTAAPSRTSAPSSPPPPPARAQPGAATPAQRERDARRTALLRGTSAGAGVPAKASAAGTRPVLQYHRTEGAGGVLGADLAQRPLWVRAAVWLLGLGLLGALAYGALELTRKLRAGEASLVAPDVDDGAAD